MPGKSKGDEMMVKSALLEWRSLPEGIRSKRFRAVWVAATLLSCVVNGLIFFGLGYAMVMLAAKAMDALDTDPGGLSLLFMVMAIGSMAGGIADAWSAKLLFRLRGRMAKREFLRVYGRADHA